MASSTHSTGTTEFELASRLTPVMERATQDILIPQFDSRLAKIESGVSTLAQEVRMSETVIISGQQIAKRFEGVREELLARIATHEKLMDTQRTQELTLLAQRLENFENHMNTRIAAIESLTFRDLLRLMARRLLGK